MHRPATGSPKPCIDPPILLWRQVLEQKDANSLRKQLKRLMSLLLILLILAIIMFAALDPTLGGASRDARNVVVLLDASASMKAMDGDDAGSQSRLAIAKQRAKELVDSMGGGDLALIMRVDGQATPMSRFSSDAPMLGKIYAPSFRIDSRRLQAAEPHKQRLVKYAKVAHAKTKRLHEAMSKPLASIRSRGRATRVPEGACDSRILISVRTIGGLVVGVRRAAVTS